MTTRLSIEQLRTVMLAARSFYRAAIGDQLETVEVTDASVADLVSLGGAAT